MLTPAKISLHSNDQLATLLWLDQSFHSQYRKNAFKVAAVERTTHVPRTPCKVSYNWRRPVIADPVEKGRSSRKLNHQDVRLHFINLKTEHELNRSQKGKNQNGYWFPKHLFWKGKARVSSRPILNEDQTWNDEPVRPRHTSSYSFSGARCNRPKVVAWREDCCR